VVGSSVVGSSVVLPSSYASPPSSPSSSVVLPLPLPPAAQTPRSTHTKSEGNLFYTLLSPVVLALVDPGDRPVLKQQAMPVPAEIVPVYTMGMATHHTYPMKELTQRIEVECVIHPRRGNLLSCGPQRCPTDVEEEGCCCQQHRFWGARHGGVFSSEEFASRQLVAHLVHSYSKKMLESGDNQIKKKTWKKAWKRDAASRMASKDAPRGLIVDTPADADSIGVSNVFRGLLGLAFLLLLCCLFETDDRPRGKHMRSEALFYH
jgi:hypothetical protein